MLLPSTVLYVEDDRINIILMEEAFRGLPDWRLECAEDGAQALEMLPRVRPDLVLIDMNLPDMSGVSLLLQLRAAADWHAPPCIALSADDQPDQVAAARAAGFRDYWLKPVELAQLAGALRAALGRD